MDSENRGMNGGDVLFVTVVALLIVVLIGACTKIVMERIGKLEETIVQKESSNGH